MALHSDAFKDLDILCVTLIITHSTSHVFSTDTLSSHLVDCIFFFRPNLQTCGAAWHRSGCSRHPQAYGACKPSTAPQRTPTTASAVTFTEWHSSRALTASQTWLQAAAMCQQATLRAAVWPLWMQRQSETKTGCCWHMRALLRACCSPGGVGWGEYDVWAAQQPDYAGVCAALPGQHH
jgi:hypothetical protein